MPPRQSALLVLAILAVIAGAVFVLWSASGALPEGRPPIESARGAASTSAAAEEVPSPGEHPDAVVRVQVEAAGARDDEGRAPLLLSGRVLDSAGVAVAGAAVDVMRRPAASYWVLDIEYNRSVRPVTSGRTAADGTFSFELPRGRPHDLQVEFAGHARHLESDCFAGQHREITLTPAAVLIGRVSRAADDGPIAGARLRGWRAPGEQVLASRTDERGEYRLEGLPPGAITFEVITDAGVTPSWVKLRLVAGETLRHDVVIERGGVVVGAVIDASTGAPIAGAEIGEGWTFRKIVHTGEEGEYRMLGFPAPGVHELYARAPGYGRASYALNPREREAKATRTIDFALQPAGAVAGRVVDAGGTPVAGAYVATVGGGWGHGDWHAARTDSAGRYHIGEMDPRQSYALLVRADGFGQRVYEIAGRTVAGGVLDLPDVRVLAPGGVEGSVRDDRGVPLAGVDVELKGTNEDRQAWLVEEAPRTSGDPFVSTRRADTDAGGEFRFDGLSAGEYRVIASVRGGVRGELPVWVEDGRVSEGVAVEIAFGLEIRGTVNGPPSGPGFRVARLTPEEGQQLRRPSRRIDDEGLFTFRGLEPGAYTLDIVWYDDGDGETVLSSVPGVVAGADELSIPLEPRAVLAGTVVLEDGTPLRNLLVQARATGAGGVQASTRTGTGGAFRLDLTAGAVVDLLVFEEKPYGSTAVGLTPRAIVNAQAARAISPPLDGLVLRIE